MEERHWRVYDVLAARTQHCSVPRELRDMAGDVVDGGVLKAAVGRDAVEGRKTPGASK
jgi:hypothetical protein